MALTRVETRNGDTPGGGALKKTKPPFDLPVTAADPCLFRWSTAHGAWKTDNGEGEKEECVHHFCVLCTGVDAAEGSHQERGQKTGQAQDRHTKMCRARPEEGRIGKKKPSSDEDEEGEGDGEDDIGTQKKTKETRVKGPSPALAIESMQDLFLWG